MPWGIARPESIEATLTHTVTATYLDRAAIESFLQFQRSYAWWVVVVVVVVKTRTAPPNKKKK